MPFLVAQLNKQAATVALYESQGSQLREALERQTLSDSYVLELRGRLAKVTERNTASEVSLKTNHF